MSYSARIAGFFNRLFAQFSEGTSRRWTSVRALSRGFRLAWVALASVLLALSVFAFAPQAQDLFLEVRGNGWGPYFWLGFYAAVLFAWILPVYVSARWILYRFRADESLTQNGTEVCDWVCRAVPRVLAVSCLGAILVGQLMALSNAPNLFDEVSQARQDQLTRHALEVDRDCIREFKKESIIFDRRREYCDVLNANLLSQLSLMSASRSLGAENIVLVIYGAVIAISTFFLLTYWIYKTRRWNIWVRLALAAYSVLASVTLLSWLLKNTLETWGIGFLSNLPAVESPIVQAFVFAVPLVLWLLLLAGFRMLPVMWLRRISLWLWWGVTTICAVVFAALLATAIYGFTRNEFETPLGLGHLALLPPITLAIGCLLWLALTPRTDDGPTRIASLFLRHAHEREVRFDQLHATGRIWNPLFGAILVISIAILISQMIPHPVVVTDHIYRALMIPFILGLLVPVVTYISHLSFRLHAPIVLAAVIVFSIANGMRSDIHDIRIIKKNPTQPIRKGTVKGREYKRSTVRPTLEKTVERWARVNGCDLDAPGPEPTCPQPIIVSAAGGASRAAFLVASVIGKLLDKKTTGSNTTLRPFEKQLFAISGVSGGSLGAAVTYAALADSQIPSRAINSKGNPPCKPDAHDTEYFAPDHRWNNSWRNCLERILAGDFLSPVLVGLSSNDIFGAPFRGDRAEILENAWERRYAHLTGQNITDNDNPTTLARAIVDLRKKVLNDKKNWLPMLMLNGTSVTTGRRIVTSDVDTLNTEFSIDRVFPKRRLFRDAYDLHELIKTPRHSYSDVTLGANDRYILTKVNLGKRKVPRWQIWDLQTDGEPHISNLGDQRRDVNLSPDGRWIVSALPRSVNVEPVESLTTFGAKTQRKRFKTPGVYRHAIFGPDSRHIVAWNTRQATVWDIETEKQIYTTPPVRLGKRWRQRIKRATLSPNGRQLLEYIEYTGRLEYTGRFSKLLDINKGDVSPISNKRIPGIRPRFSPDGRYLVTSKREYHPPVRSAKSAKTFIRRGFTTYNILILDANSGAELHKLERPRDMGPSRIRDMAISSDGQFVTASYKDDTLIWQITDGQVSPPIVIQDTRVLRAIFRPNSNHLLIVSELVARMVDRDTGEDIRVFKGQEGLIRGAVFAHDGRRLLTWDDNGAARVWAVDTGVELETFKISRGTFASCKDCDIRLSTAVSTSARFPVISPHGNIRNGERTIVDRVVDGGYYENFGAITAFELAEVLRSRYNLRPAVILINNEPAVTGMNCITPDGRLTDPDAPKAIPFSILGSPVSAVMGTRGARGTHAAVTLCSEVGPKNFAFITVNPDRTNKKKTLSMSWWLSKHVQKYLDDQVNTKRQAINRRAFNKIRGWRR